MIHLALDWTKSLCGEYTTSLSHIVRRVECKKCLRIHKSNTLHEFKVAEKQLQKILAQKKKLEGEAR